MFKQLKQRIQTIQEKNLTALLKDAKTGIEKESLRVNTEGRISQLNHPQSLGSSFTHPCITTDYAESLLELITPPCKRAIDAYEYLLDIETFVYQHIGDELLWTTSMPCVLKGEDDIHIADYGSSNAGKMKTIYRHGLAWRYGKTMQVIAGIHFNYSISESFWPAFQKIENNQEPLQNFINDRYMAITRNIQRYGWLIPYFFGSSPAICKSFLGEMPKPKNMEALNQFTYYEPSGTSLRMGDIGYTNRKESKVGIKANYNSLEKYTKSLEDAITTPYQKYEKIGIKVDGEYRQLNSNILQIENEYYSSVRPKQVLQGFERPIDALRKRGIQYVELRSLDINPFHPAGMTRDQLFFLEVFMHFCLLQESPKITKEERNEIDNNQSLVAHQGRLTNLKLNCMGRKITLKQQASDIIAAMSGVAELLDQTHNSDCYQQSLEEQAKLVAQPNLTPSAKLLNEIRSHNDSFFGFAQRKSKEHRNYFQKRQLSPELMKKFTQVAKSSIEEQKLKESEDELPFDTFLSCYLSGKL